MRSYVTAQARAQTVDVLLAAQVALLSLRVLGFIYVALAGESELSRMFLRGARLSAPFLLVLFIGAAIAFFLWLDRATRNLTALGATRPIEPEHAVGAFLVPVVNVFVVPWVVRRLWLQSDPTPPPRGRDWMLLAAWWPTLLLSLLLQPLGVPLVVDGLRLVAGLALLAIVRDIQRRQDEQWIDGERRRAVPQPSAEALR
jgi:uncharacterized protein DUF4328